MHLDFVRIHDLLDIGFVAALWYGQCANHIAAIVKLLTTVRHICNFADITSALVYTRILRILFGYNVYASRIHIIDRGWMREKEKEREGRGGKKRERKDVETVGRGWKRYSECREIQGIKPR